MYNNHHIKNNSLEMKEELEENKKYCNKICKTAMMTCMNFEFLGKHVEWI